MYEENPLKYNLTRKIEKKELEKIENMIVFRLRHGETDYHEHTGEKKLNPGECDITETGRKMMEKDAEIIMQQIDKNNDIICVVSSPRIRAKNGKDIIEHELRLRGYNVWEGDVVDEPQKFIRGLDMYDSDGEVIDLEDSEYSVAYNKMVEEMEKIKPVDQSHEQFYSQLEDDRLETVKSAGERARYQLSKFVRIARNVQLKINKRIVIVEIEHCETLNDIYSEASSGEYSMEKDTGPARGEMIRLDIPTDSSSDEIGVKFLGENRKNKESVVKYDYLRKKFTNEK